MKNLLASGSRKFLKRFLTYLFLGIFIYFILDYPRRRLASEGIVTLDVTLCVCPPH